MPLESFETRIPRSSEVVQEILIRNPEASELVSRPGQERRRDKVAALQTELAETKARLLHSESRAESLLQTLAGLTASLRTLVSAQTRMETEGPPLLREHLEGEVVDSTDDAVAVEYETPNGTLTQTYRRSQFAGGRMPALGDRIVALAVLCVAAPGETKSLAELLSEPDELPASWP